MLFSSLIFIFAFLPVVWAVFHLLKALKFKAHFEVAKIFLIVASLFFYAWWKVEYLPILLGSIIVNFALAKMILNFANLCQIRKNNESEASPSGLQGDSRSKNTRISENSISKIPADFNPNSRENLSLSTIKSTNLTLNSPKTPINSAQNSFKTSQNHAAQSLSLSLSLSRCTA